MCFLGFIKKGLQEHPGQGIERLGKTFCHALRDRPFAALDFGNMSLGNAKSLGKLFLRDIFPDAKAAHNLTRMGVGEYFFKGIHT